MFALSDYFAATTTPLELVSKRVERNAYLLLLPPTGERRGGRAPALDATHTSCVWWKGRAVLLPSDCC